MPDWLLPLPFLCTVGMWPPAWFLWPAVFWSRSRMRRQQSSLIKQPPLAFSPQSRPVHKHWPRQGATNSHHQPTCSASFVRLHEHAQSFNFPTCADPRPPLHCAHQGAAPSCWTRPTVPSTTPLSALAAAALIRRQAGVATSHSRRRRRVRPRAWAACSYSLTWHGHCKLPMP